jgi:uncharacterized protein (DUF885 family)
VHHNRTLLVVLTVALAVSCGPPGNPNQPNPAPLQPKPVAPEKKPAPEQHAANADDAAIAKAGQDFVDLIATISPETATELGLHQHDTELDDRSIAGFEHNVALEEKMLADLEARFGSTDPPEAGRREHQGPHASRSSLTDLEIMEHTLAVDVRMKRAEDPLRRKPDTYTEPMNAIFLMTARDYAPAAVRATNALARIEKIPAQLEEAKKNLGAPPKPGAARKWPPKVWTEVGIESAGGAKQFFDDERAPIEAALPAEKPRIEKAIHAVEKAYADYAQYLKKVVLPHGGNDFAAGPELFDFLLHEDFFLTENAPDLVAMGQRIFDKTEAQMTEVAHRIDPKAKSWAEVVVKVKGHHPTAKDLLPSYRKELARARQFLIDKDVVTLPPGDDCEVIETPPFQRSTVTAAYDQPPPFDHVTKGFFFVTPVDAKASKTVQEEMLRENDHGDEVDTATHEAYPGHHLQLSIARRNPSVVRKATGPSIFAEGWALYAEELMAELGMYSDEERLMQLEWTLVRAARILIDVGLHTRGMTFDQAVHVLTDKVHLERPLAVSEVKRYTETPTQPSSYLVGREKILALRERAKKEWGKSFTLKRFHDELLSHGTIAPGLIEREMFPPH